MSTSCWKHDRKSGDSPPWSSRDEHPDSIVAKLTERFDPTNDSQSNDGFWSDDIIELMLDTDLDRESFVHMGINSLGVYADEYFSLRGNISGEGILLVQMKEMTVKRGKVDGLPTISTSLTVN